MIGFLFLAVVAVPFLAGYLAALLTYGRRVRAELRDTRDALRGLQRIVRSSEVRPRLRAIDGGEG